MKYCRSVYGRSGSYLDRRTPGYFNVRTVFLEAADATRVDDV